MNSLIIALLVSLLFVGNVSAMDQELCTAVSSLANSIMDCYQHRAKTLPEVYVFAEESESEYTTKVIKQLAKMAYAHPQYTTEKYQQREVDKFENSVFLNCLNANDMGELK